MNKKYILIFFLISFFLNILVFFIDVIPFAKAKLKDKYFKEESIVNNNKVQDVILSKSMEMLNNESINVWSDHKGFAASLYDFSFGFQDRNFKKYNYTRSFFYYGLSTYLIKNKDTLRLDMLKKSFDNLIDYKGNAKFTIDKVDQISFGLTALNLYEFYKEKKYLYFSNVFYKKIPQFSNKEGIILYRKDDIVQLNDAIAMTVPFLLAYSKTVKSEDAKEIAKKQLDFFIKYGVDKETYLPTHGINLKTKIKVGPTNWGRGIGWYFIGLSQYYKNTGEFKKEFEGLSITLNKLKNNESLWSQFPGSSVKFDASTSTMFLYCLNINKNMDKRAVISLFSKYISPKGIIMQTSGDTSGINRYSNAFGESELSQGILLLLLANSK